MNFFQKAKFYITVNDLFSLPEDNQFEVAFVGRSNAGKSSAINVLAQQNRLAFVSKQPGRTQHINFFQINENRFFVDLPGYGFARVEGKMKQHWNELISGYLTYRQSLKGLVLMMDVRHPNTALDLQLLRWFQPQNKPVHVLLTKADKLSRGQALQTLATVQKELNAQFHNCTVQLFSSLKRQGIEQAGERIATWLELFPTPPIATESDYVE